MMWYLLGIILSLVVFFYGNSIGMSVILKWTIIALIWAASAHMDMKTKDKEKSKEKESD
ncbi:hypothetical protein SDC9_149174 [bioreactor metagenome]|uniref:Uncharacterized protein n=1 Tax=bioreactor metagenome TaxID=1076179 RepID=A0A645EJ26_9ZZZZ